MMLDFIQSKLEKSISNWEIVSTEDLLDEDQDEVVRVLNFDRGTSDPFIVVSPKCFIAGTSSKIPSSLLVDVHNTLNSVMWTFVRSYPTVPN